MSKSRKIHPVAATKPGGVVRSRTVASKDKLLRLPHIFAKVLTLPFHADTPVSLSETRCSMRFSVPAHDVTGGVVAEPIEIYPGVVKVVLRAQDGVVWPGEEFDICAWRFRLPDSTRPEMASASCVDGELVVVVPKIIDDGVVGGGGNRLLLVNRRLK